MHVVRGDMKTEELLQRMRRERAKSSLNSPSPDELRAIIEKYLSPSSSQAKFLLHSGTRHGRHGWAK